MTSDADQLWYRAELYNNKTSPECDIIDHKSTAKGDVRSSSRVLQHRNWVQVITGTDHRVNGVLHSSTSHELITANGSTPRFRVATYNILTDNAIKPGEYLYCPSQLRYMSSRHERIMDEISNLQPHVICFQVSRLSSVYVSATLTTALLNSRLLYSAADVHVVESIIQQQFAAVFNATGSLNFPDRP